MKKYTIQILMLLMLVVAMGTTSMAEVPISSNRTTFTTTGNAIAPEYSSFQKFYFNETLLEANAGQEMILHITSVENRAFFKIKTPLGKTLNNTGEGKNTMYWHGILPVSGEYKIIVGATQGHTVFRLKITIQDAPSHTVSPGETLSQIAKHYGYQVAELIAWNNLPSPYHLTTGQKLRIYAPLKHPIQSDTNLNVFLNRLVPEKTEPTGMVSETKKIKTPASKNSLIKILETMNPVQSKPAAQVAKTGTSQANFVKMLEAMKAPVQPKKNEPVSEIKKDNNASQANFIKMLEAMKVPVETPEKSEKEESIDKTKTPEISQKPDAVTKRQSWAYKHTIHPTWPELTFKLIGSVLQNAQTAEIAAIEFYQGHEQKPFQTLSNLDIPIAIPKQESSFKLKDMNLDGYQDFFLVTTSASEFYVCWVFDPNAKIFVKLLLDCGW